MTGGGKVLVHKRLRRLLAKKQVQNNGTSDRQNTVGLQEPPTQRILPKGRLELMRLTEEAINETKKERAVSTQRNSAKPSEEVQSPGVAEMHS